MSGLDDIENRMNALKSEINAITQTVRHLRLQKALSIVKRAEQQLIKSQMDARTLSLPVSVLGTGQCKHQKMPYSLIKPSPRSHASGRPKNPKQ